MHIEENPNEVRAVDLIVGIPSYNEAKLISYPTQMASEGLIKYFGDKNSPTVFYDERVAKAHPPAIDLDFGPRLAAANDDRDRP